MDVDFPGDVFCKIPEFHHSAVVIDQFINTGDPFCLNYNRCFLKSFALDGSR